MRNQSCIYFTMVLLDCCSVARFDVSSGLGCKLVYVDHLAFLVNVFRKSAPGIKSETCSPVDLNHVRLPGFVEFSCPRGLLALGQQF